tara:strand:+ start:311 stop:1147 length:837 start_codon:yes stop_codon:yes gene_type:complete
MSEKVIIICKTHGPFEQTPGSHITNKSGCPKCGFVSQLEKRKTGLKKFIKQSKKIHGDKFDYSKVEYINSRTNVTIICKIHGEFYPRPGNHINSKSGCPKCSIIKQHEKQKKTLNEFITQSKEVHGDTYDYSNVEYVDNKTNVKIICKLHGEFYPTPNNHLRGSGCPVCKSSKGEKEIIKLLKKYKINYLTQYSFDDLKLKGKLRCDFYLPEKNVVIEYNGEQHYKPNEFYGGKKGFELTQKRDKLKKEYCLNNGIDFLEIKFSDDIETKLKIYLEWI